MVFDFTKTVLVEPHLPSGFWFIPWSMNLSEAHGDVLHRSFQNDLDGTVFTTFQEFNRCVSLIETVAQSPSFLPETSLMVATGDPHGLYEFIATIQGLKLSNEIGAVQNVGVLSDYRQRGVATNLVLAALQEFRKAGLQRVTLEATADNLPAMRLYSGLGFTVFNTYLREIFD
ncbi:MAG: GNAT family N-acetyltransferase [Planctomycetaceae bacterium]|jgi:predicted GNAT family acetyltransferase|nr:GNAT family N-acetyltransferase [Planctomycetaceae bacterium]